MLSTIAPPLRSAAVSCRLLPAIANTYQISPISTLVTQAPNSTTSSKTATANNQIRHASTDSQSTCSSYSSISEETKQNTSATTSATLSTPTSQSTSTSPSSQITWNAFFMLRKRRRWWQLASSVASSSSFTVGGIGFLSKFDPNAFASAIPQVDPMLTMGASTMGFGVVGWLVGPFVGAGIWRWRNKGVVRDVEIKEREFFTRIKKHRVDPAGSSMQNPVPDYYGEKIGSVQDYRRWMKDQRAFNKKRLASIV